METNDPESEKYESAYNYAYELLAIKNPEWSKQRLSKAAHLYVTVMLAIAVTDEHQQRIRQ